ncbi:MAG: ABC transporter ATP-binding protein [Planctomycetota bacterium]
MSFIQLQNISKTYRRGEHVVRPLNEVDLSIKAGEFFALLGPSGSGKTTLLNLIAGIDRPDSGDLIIGGKNLNSLSERALTNWRAENVGYVFQQNNLVPVLTAYENVELPLWLFPLSRKQRHERVSLALEAVGLTDRHDHLPKQLSGGQEQRVAIARAIVVDPPIIVADEPTGNLDEESADVALTLLGRFRSERGKTVVMVTHDPNAASRASRAMSLDKGKLTPLSIAGEKLV